MGTSIKIPHSAFRILLTAVFGLLLFTAAPTPARAACDCVCNFSGGRSEPQGPSADQPACQGVCVTVVPPGETLVAAECGPEAPPAAPGAPADANAIPKLINPLGAGTTVQTLLGRIINAFLGIAGSISLLMFVYGGFMWLTSGGSEDKIKKGRETLVWATLGLAIIFSAYALLNFFIRRALGVI